MAEYLLIRFDRADGGDAATYMACNEAGEVVQPPRRGTLAEAAAQAGARRPVGLLPASDVVTLDAELPARAGAKLLQAVPYALEEQVAEDIDDLHFAIGARAADGRTPVAVVSRGLMQAIEDSCAAAGLSLQALHAESALMAPRPGQVVVLFDGEELHVCRPDARPVTLPSRTPAESLALALDGAATGTLGLLVFASPADWQAHGPEVEALRGQFAGFKAQLLPQGPLPWLAQGLTAAAPVNLLQGRFAPRRAAGGDGWRRWRVAAALAGVLVLLTAAGDLWRASRLAAAERAVDAALADAVRPVIPNPVGAREARRQVEARLAAVRGGASAQGDFLPALAALAAARNASPDTELKALGYRSGSFEVRLKARDAASLERIGAALREGGWATDLLGGTGSGEAYEGRLRISAAGAAGSGS
jgi:general secretion pathway protein L